jgi:hypothetical protein
LCAGNKTSGPTNLSESEWLQSRAAKCVEFHESTTINGITYNPRAFGNIWQVQGSTWLLPLPPGHYSAAVQNAAAYALWLRRGWEPWLADYRVCGL